MSNLSEITSGVGGRFDGTDRDWVTGVEVPDPNPLPNIVGWNILIRPVPIQETIKMAGGSSLILPGSLTEDVKFLTNVGQVKAMGSMCYMDPDVKEGNPHGRYKQPWCKVGDYVVWGKHQGVRLVVKGVAFVLLKDELVLMTLNDPTDINPLFNAFKM